MVGAGLWWGAGGWGGIAAGRQGWNPLSLFNWVCSPVCCCCCYWSPSSLIASASCILQSWTRMESCPTSLPCCHCHCGILQYMNVGVSGHQDDMRDTYHLTEVSLLMFSSSSVSSVTSSINSKLEVCLSGSDITQNEILQKFIINIFEENWAVCLSLEYSSWTPSILYTEARGTIMTNQWHDIYRSLWKPQSSTLNSTHCHLGKIFNFLQFGK